MGNLQLFRRVVPYVDQPFRHSDYKLLAKAYVEACDLISVELLAEVTDLCHGVCLGRSRGKGEVNCHELIVVRYQKQLVCVFAHTN